MYCYTMLSAASYSASGLHVVFLGLALHMHIYIYIYIYMQRRLNAQGYILPYIRICRAYMHI